MYQNTEIHTVNTGIDMTKKYGNFTFEDILDGIFSQEKMDTWQAADWDVKENKTRNHISLQNFLTIFHIYQFSLGLPTLFFNSHHTIATVYTLALPCS